MPKYNLLCTRDHEFEGWFASEKSYLDQKNKKLIAIFGGKWTTAPSTARKIVTIVENE